MRLEHAGQFWEIQLDERSFVTCAGRIGTRGTATAQSFATLELARRAHDRAIVERLDDGYRVVERPPLALPGVSDPALEAAIREGLRGELADPGPHLVYADARWRRRSRGRACGRGSRSTPTPMGRAASRSWRR